MAMVVSISGEEKPRRSSFRSEKRPWMLRDYLRDDMSSCSSNGFKSFPRRQCCVAVKEVIIRNGRKSNHSKPPAKRFAKNRTISSALHRASVAVINAVKLLPFKSPAPANAGSGDGNWLLTRSFSKKLFKRSFWMKKSTVGGGGGERKAVVEKKGEECDEIERWISSGIVGTEKYKPLDLSNDTTVTSNSNSNSDGKSDSWSDITFTSDCLTSSSENDGVERREKSGEEEVSKRVGVTAGQDSVAPAVTKSTWCNEVEKEHYSPTSILDFPEIDEGKSSPFTLRVTRLKGTKERLMEKLGRFESLAGLGLEPVNLESLISFTEREDRSPKFSVQSCSTPSYIISSEDEEEEEEDNDDFVDDDDDDSEEEEEEESLISEVEKRATHLLNTVKDRVPTKTTNKFEYDNVLLEFFRENTTEMEEITLLKAAEDWVNGHYDRSILGWEVKDKRRAYIRDMEERGRWPRDTKAEKEEVATELGAEILSHLIEELLLEFCST